MSSFKHCVAAAAMLCAGLGNSLHGAGTNYVEVAMAAWRAGQVTNALALVAEGLKADPKSARLWNMQAHMKALRGDRESAIADLTEAIRLEPQSAPLWQERAKLRFRLNRMHEAVGDFDRAIRLRPEAEPYNWERGIALYYAGYFSDGRRQFESHQTVNSNDVENAVWHFLCVARAKGIEEARKNLIPIEGDARIPMKEVHSLFAGKLKPEDVLAAAEKSSGGSTLGPGTELTRQRFYAHLYLGLYFEALGDKAKTKEHITAAAGMAEVADYMGDVARVHVLRLEEPAAKK